MRRLIMQRRSVEHVRPRSGWKTRPAFASLDHLRRWLDGNGRPAFRLCSSVPRADVHVAFEARDVLAPREAVAIWLGCFASAERARKEEAHAASFSSLEGMVG